MNTLLFAAGVLAILVGTVHSVLGEILIFAHLRQDTIVPTVAISPLKERHTRILWASWHVVTILGWAIGAILLDLAMQDAKAVDALIFEAPIVVAMALSAVLVLYATKGKHPGWIGLLAVATLVAFA